MNKTVIPDLCNINFASDINTLIASSKNYADLANLHPDEITTALAYDYVKQEKLDSVSDFFVSLHNDNLDQFDDQFKLYWLEKFWTSHDQVKSDVHRFLGSNNEYYINFSESIGSITNIEYIKTNSALNWYNVTGTADASATGFAALKQDIEYTVTSPSYNKMTINSKILNMYLSRRTNILLKTNMKNVINSAEVTTEYTSNDSHGCNLIVDSEYYERVKDIIDDIKQPLRESLKGLYDTLIYVQHATNSQYVNPVGIDIDVEGLNQTITLLKNKMLQKPDTNTNITILQ